MRYIIFGLFLILSNTVYTQDFSFRTKYLTESIAIGERKVSFADVRVTYEKNILKIYDLTLDKYVIDKSITLKEYKANRYTGITDNFVINVDKIKRQITLLNVKDIQETYTFSLHKQ